MIKTGARLASQVDATMVVVVRSADSLDDLRCGGMGMVPLGDVDASSDSSATPDPALSDGTVMGKRYVDESGAELLVTKAGVGTLTIGETRLRLKEAKPLPASD